MPSWEGDLTALLESPDDSLEAGIAERTEQLLDIAEAAITAWLHAHDVPPTAGRVEGFRLLALHRQGARVDPSFNACRESCRELIFQCNMAQEEPVQAARRLRLAAMVCRHLVLFVFGKLGEAALGEFCCAARPLRAAEAT